MMMMVGWGGWKEEREGRCLLAAATTTDRYVRSKGRASKRKCKARMGRVGKAGRQDASLVVGLQRGREN